MPNLEALIAFSVVCFALSITPGPSILYIAARSLSQGPSAGVAAASGMAIGSFAYVIATILGLSAIFAHAPLLYSTLKIIGALYLVYLGWQYFKPNVHSSEKHELQSLSNLRIMKQSFIVEITNPKTALFFIAFFPQFVSENTTSISIQLLVLGIIYTLITLLCDTFIAITSGKISKKISVKQSAVNWQDKLAGSIMFLLAVFMAAETLS
ncbi:LysE family translocator [Pseudoalteromonas phenolica]|uniref:Putative threonine efflux protein n=1 Tax=Pseudoalteromonas phenolica TaxID=161398 RepID=A0A0S2K7U2_9GAMM|nr:LysE family translocator [Pseudoalteromonas phenolica]ALO44281.1 Putative threonine efflux protein [Pseudoalteromonas phenolica]MBE0357278.1 hypothetical protein [Pseudoalteromonas phenolica O-BC30]